jgi:DNA polymerase II small subunit/DNA polymerase delta subunit B
MIIEIAHSSEAYKNLREETVLDGFKSAAATLILGEELIKWIKSDEGISKNTLLREWEISGAVQSHNDYEEQVKTWEEIEKAKSLKNINNKKLKDEKKNADFKVNAIEGELKDLIKEQKDILAKLDKKIEKQIQSSLVIASDGVEEAEDEIKGWGLR